MKHAVYFQITLGYGKSSATKTGQFTNCYYTKCCLCHSMISCVEIYEIKNEWSL